MGHYNGSSPKRHRLYSNDTLISEIVKEAGYMSRDDMKKIQEKNKDKALTRTYLDKQGKKRCAGTKFLKGSQCVTQFCPEKQRLLHGKPDVFYFVPLVAVAPCRLSTCTA